MVQKKKKLVKVKKNKKKNPPKLYAEQEIRFSSPVLTFPILDSCGFYE